MSEAMTILFSYGSLQDKNVQLANFGRELTGRKEVLPGYTLRTIPRSSSKQAVPTEGASDLTVEPSANPDDTVPGVVYEITEQELAAADQYEAVFDYYRISAALQSRDPVWVYVRHSD
jgi:hypothetical protein